jgi:hypothetical protein
MNLKVATRIVPVLFLALAACGGDSGGESGDKLKTAVSEAFLASAGEEDMPFAVDEEMAGCVADAVLSDATYKDKLQSALDEGLAGQELLDSAGDPTSDEAMMEPIFSCFSNEQFVELLSGEAVDPSTVADEEKQCLIDEFDKMGKDLVVEGFIALSNEKNSGEGATKLTAAMISCFGVESFG